MKPTEHKPPLEKELIAHIRESLVEHEESYQLGAWEKFNAPEKKHRPFWLPFLQGTAAILIVGFVGFLILNKKPTVQQITKVEVKKPEPIDKEPIKPEKIEPKKDVEIASQKPAVSSNIHQTENQKSNGLNDKLPLETNNQQVAVINNSPITTQNRNVTPVQDQVVKADVPVVANNKVDNPKVNIIDFLDNETKNNKAKKADEIASNKKSKFTVGLVVAPSFGNVKRLNMGYGVSVDYSLSDKFSLNSGLAYNQMAASAGPQNNMAAADMPAASAIAKSTTTKSLESIEEQVTGIDIPLEIKYHVSKSFYANVGVSAFAVINQKRNNTYLEQKVVQQYNNSMASSNTFSSVLVSERVTEAETTKTEDYKYLGFYNLSFGYKKKISKNNAFAVEPFLKLPMREVKTENLRLIGTGVKLKFDF